MFPRLQHLSADQIQIRQNNPWYLRLLGLPTLLVGLYIAYHLVAGVIHYIVHRATLAEWLSAIPAEILFALIAALFLVPSLYWMLAFSRRTTIDRNRKIIRKQSGSWPFRSREEFDLEEISGIEIFSEESRTTTMDSGHRRTHSTWLETIRLLREDGDPIDVATYTAAEKDMLDTMVSELSQWLSLEVTEREG